MPFPIFFITVLMVELLLGRKYMQFRHLEYHRNLLVLQSLTRLPVVNQEDYPH